MDAIDGTHTQQQQGGAAPPSMLTIILDTNPLSWSRLAERHALSLETFVASLLVFTNAHLAFSTENRVAILAAHLGRTHWLYPIPDGSAPLPPTNPNKYRPFALVESAVLWRLNQLLEQTTPEDIASADDTVPLAGPLTLALTYANRLNIALSPNVGNASDSAAAAGQAGNQPVQRALVSRILVVSVSAADLAGQYIPLTNAMFAAQHERIPIDVLKLAGDTALLQQAAYTTGGRYVAPIGLADDASSESKPKKDVEPVSLLPYLMTALLPDPTARALLVSPTSPHVDFRAACFCHRRVIDTGFVCSICLSIFCSAEELPDMMCLTCGTKLVLGSEVDELPAANGAGASGEPKKKKKKDKEKKKEASGTPA